MNNKYSNYLTSIKPLLENLVKELSKEYKYVSILGSDSTGKRINVSSNSTQVKENPFNERGFVLRIHNGYNYAEYSFNEIDENKIDYIKERIKSSLLINSSIKSSKHIQLKEYEILNEESLTKDFYKDFNNSNLTTKEIIDKLNGYVKEMMNSDNVVNAFAIYVNSNISKVFISNKRNITQFYSWTNVMTMPIVFDGKNSNSFYGACSGSNDKEVFEKQDIKIKQTIKNAQDLLNSTQPIPGVYDVITSPEVTGLIAHEAFGHGVEMDMFVKQRALATKYINSQVASSITTMHEAAKGNEECSSYFFDDEGVLAHDTIEIQNGILKTGVCDSISALTLNIEPTGNGKRQSFERKAYTRMTSTYFESSKDKLEDMIKSIKKGYLIEGMHSGMEDPKNWGIQCAAALGREIIDGKFTGKVIAPVMMTGYVPDLLNSISMISENVELFGSGMCGKGYKEWVKTADGGPYLKVRVNIG